MRRIEHPFFDGLDWVSKHDSWRALNHPTAFPKRLFFQCLKKATPIIYDQKCTEVAMSEAGGEVNPAARIDIPGMNQKTIDKARLVEEFTLPHATSLYLLTHCPTIIRMDKEGKPFIYKRLGYLLVERQDGGEKIMVFDIMSVKAKHVHGDDKKEGEPDYFLPDFYEIDLSKFNRDPSMKNFASDIVAINRLTNMISVKRVGIEIASFGRTIKTKGIDAGYTTLKTERLCYVADKVEYEYIQREPGITWYDYNGHWRGHWRAFYKYHNDERMIDERGRDLVDYTRIGKNRSGEYKVEGYTWVCEHTKGNPLYAQIKTKYVKSS